MNPLVAALLATCAIALLVLPRRWAPAPIIAVVCYLTRAQLFSLGVYSFTPVRILIVVGLARLMIRREWLPGGFNGLDRLMLAWGGWMVLSTSFHIDPAAKVVERLGFLMDGWGLYFLFRIFCRSREDLALLFRVVAVLLVPIAVEMVIEKVTVRNVFAVFGGVPEVPAIRDGRIRAQGPFAHAILAGNIGAVIIPLMIGLWAVHKKTAILGIAACITVVLASSSSGPIMSALLGLFALCWWPYRDRLHIARRAAVACYVFLMLVMNSAPYYLIARIDLAGGSTGWHRSRLIESAFEHIDEWWFAGTDYTRHWMPTGVSYSPDHTDITNHYLMAGVLGGLPLMILFILVLWLGFVYIGRSLPSSSQLARRDDFLTFSTGAALFGHAATCIAVAYFDQSIAFLYLTLAATSAVLPVGASPAAEAATTTPVSVVNRSRRNVKPAPRPRSTPSPAVRRYGRTRAI